MSSDWIYVKPPLRNAFFGQVKHRLIAPRERTVEIIVSPIKLPRLELALTALAIDASRCMLRMFAANLPKILRKKQNKVGPIAKELALFLASNSRNQCAIAYWACGSDGSEIEPVGLMTSAEIQTCEFPGVSSDRWGGGTKLTPIVRYFWEEIFAAAHGPGVAVILTDSAWDDDDHAELLELTARMWAEIAAGRRALMKCVILAMTTEENRSELSRLDARLWELGNYEAAEGIDIWNWSWINEVECMDDLLVGLLGPPLEMFRLGDGGYVEAAGKRVLQADEFRFGIQFKLPAAATAFTLHLNDVGEFTQTLN
jgi:hypothetical protein